MGKGARKARAAYREKQEAGEKLYREVTAPKLPDRGSMRQFGNEAMELTRQALGKLYASPHARPFEGKASEGGRRRFGALRSFVEAADEGKLKIRKGKGRRVRAEAAVKSADYILASNRKMRREHFGERSV